MHKLATAPKRSSAIDIGADLAGGCRGLKKRPKGGSESLLEVRGQGVEGRVSRVQGRGEPAFGCNKGRVSLHPSSQRLAGLVLGSQDRRGVCAGIDFVTEDGRDEVGALRKVAVNGADADAGLFGDLSHRSVHSRGREHRHGRLEQRIDVALRVGAHAPIRAAARLDAITVALPVCRSPHLHLTNGTLFRINTECRSV